MCGWNGYGWNGGYGGGWGWVGWTITAVVLVLVFAVLITAVVFAIRYFSSGGHRGLGGSQQERGAEDVLAERFARGEIDADEYRQRVTLLREHR